MHFFFSVSNLEIDFDWYEPMDEAWLGGSYMELRGVFPYTHFVFTSPLKPSRKRTSVYIEGRQDQIDILELYLQPLLRAKRDLSRGVWEAIFQSEEKDTCLQILYNPEGNTLSAYQLLVFIFREHLARLCDLKLLSSSQFSCYHAGHLTAQYAIPLAQIKNGTREFPIIIQNPRLII